MRAIPMLMAAALAGCGALTDYHSARTLAPGETEVGLEASAITVAEEARVDGALPSAAVTSRHGLSDGFELGLRMGSMGAEVTGKWRLYDGGVIVAAAPTAGGFILGPETWWAGVRAPVLIEVPFGEGHGVVFSPRVQAQYIGVDDFFGSGAGVAFLANAGLGVALSLRLGPIALVPELAAALPFVAINTRGESADGAFDGTVLLLQGGLGVRWRFGE